MNFRLIQLFVLTVWPLLAISVFAQENEAPVPQFTFAPDSVGTTQTYFIVDAGTSTDDATSTELLEVRWDWEGDGEFDTDFSTTKIDTIRYDLAGLFNIALQVRDAAGAVSTLERTVTVEFEQDAGTIPMLVHDPFEFDFLFTDIVFDPARPIAYAIMGEHRKMYIVDLQSGLIDRDFSFVNEPVALGLTPDGTRLFIAFHTAEEAPWPSRNKIGNIIEFSLSNQSTIGGFKIIGNLIDLVVTDKGILFGLDGNNLRSYRVADGEMIGEEGVGPMDFVQLASNQSHVYATAMSSDVGIVHLVHEGGVILDDWKTSNDAPGGSMYGNVFLSPVGDRLITQQGDQFTMSEDEPSDLEYLGKFTESALKTVLFDVVNNVFYTSNYFDVEVDVFSLTDDSWLGTLESSFRVGKLGVVGDSLYIYREWPNNPKSFFEKHYNPAVDPPNAPPAAQLSVSQTMGTTLHPIRFDATASTDAETPDALKVKWDWESDGDFDSRFNSDLIVDYTYTLPGTYEATLVVKDYFGMTDTTSISVQIEFEEDPGALPDSLNDPFLFGHHFTDVVFDPSRLLAYTSDIDEKKIRIINLVTGLIEKEFDFQFEPESLYLMPDGSRLYAALLTRNHDTYWSDESGHVGVIAEFDLTRQVKTNQYLINEDPYNLFVTQDGYLFVMSGSGNDTFVRSYEAATGAPVDSLAGVLNRSNMTLHPDEDRFYISTNFEAERVGIEAGKMGERWSAPEGNDAELIRKMFANPDGSVLINREGNIFSSSNEQSSDMMFIGALEKGPYGNIVFDERNEVILAVSNEALDVYRIEDYSIIHSEVLPKFAVQVGAYFDELFVASDEIGDFWTIRAYPHGSLGALPIDRLGSDIPDQFVIEQNFPNPFNETTQIKLAVSEPGAVSVTIFNVAGQKVATLQDGFMSAGYYTLDWHPQNLSTGVYFARMTAAQGFQQVVRLLLVN